MRGVRHRKPEGCRTKRRTRRAINHKFQIAVVVWEIEQVLKVEFRLKLLDKHKGIFRIISKEDQRSSITEHGVMDIGG